MYVKNRGRAGAIMAARWRLRHNHAFRTDRPGDETCAARGELSSGQP
jgi:hypothetical protein